MESLHKSVKYSLQFFRSISSSRINLNSKNHYDVLEVSPKATQADIKTSYYKLSKEYHPDTSKSKDAVQKFRELTESYEILGNVKLRRLYDKGMHHVTLKDKPPGTSHEYEDDPTTRFYKSREIRHKPPPPTGRTTYYNFDEWSRSHYGATFSKNMHTKKHMERGAARVAEFENDARYENIIYCMTILFFLMCYISHDMHSYDDPIYKRHDNDVPSDVKK